MKHIEQCVKVSNADIETVIEEGQPGLQIQVTSRSAKNRSQNSQTSKQIASRVASKQNSLQTSLDSKP